MKDMDTQMYGHATIHVSYAQCINATFNFRDVPREQPAFHAKLLDHDHAQQS
jgi:hypothetical protein